MYDDDVSWCVTYFTTFLVDSKPAVWVKNLTMTNMQYLIDNVED